MKIVKIILVGILLFLIAGTVVIRFFFPAARIRALAQSQIRSQMHREAQMGDISLGLFGLSIERFRLSEKPGFAAGTFLYVENVRIRWSLWPLLHRRLWLSNVLLEQPQVNLIRLPDGKTLNISDLIQETNQRAMVPPEVQWAAIGTQAAPAARSDWTWFIREIRLKEGIIRLDDRSPAQQSTSLNDINLLLKDFDATRMQGRLTISLVQNAFYKARDLSVEWALTDLDPTFGHANGWAKLRQGPGSIDNIPALVSSGKSARTLFLPLMLLQNLDHAGILRIGGPDLRHWVIEHISGDYTFDHGTMRIQNFTVTSRQLGMQAGGWVQLASGQLDVDVHLQAPKTARAGAMDLQMHLSGTLNHPKTDIQSLKQQAFKATVNGLLQSSDVRDQVDKALQKLFH